MAQTPFEPDHGSTRGTPRWVKVVGSIILVLILVVVISLLTGARHGPGMHTPSGAAGGYSRHSSSAAHSAHPSWS